MSRGYIRLPQFPGQVTSENKSKFRFSVRTPTSEKGPPSISDAFLGEKNFSDMSSADEPLIPPQNGGFDDDDYLSEGNKQNYGSGGNDKSRRKGKGLCYRCWWFLCCGWKNCCLRQVKDANIELNGFLPDVLAKFIPSLQKQPICKIYVTISFRFVVKYMYQFLVSLRNYFILVAPKPIPCHFP